MQNGLKLYRGSILHFPSSTASPDTDYVYFSDGLLVMRNDKIIALDDYSAIKQSYNEQKVVDLRGQLIIPGLIDSHLHFPQTEMIASYGEQLLAWLEEYTFPTEAKFSSVDYALAMADIFLDQLFKNGTTTGLVFSSVHKQATDALFEKANQRNICLVAGKVCMDRHCPEELRDSPQSAYEDSKALIDKWHGKNRLHYALTPRFAPTSSAEQLSAIGELATSYPDVFVQTHLSENQQEIDWVKSLFTDCHDYLSVYEKFNLVRKRSVLGHCLHLSASEWQRLQARDATAAFCPSSNLFLGSGLFDLATANHFNVNVALASDVGAGTSFSMLRTMGDAYKVSQLNQYALSPLSGLYMMTQGAASQYELAASVGNLNVGSHADFVVLDPSFSRLSQLRCNRAGSDAMLEDPQDILFALSMLADERAISATYVAGECVYQRQKDN